MSRVSHPASRHLELPLWIPYLYICRLGVIGGTRLIRFGCRSRNSVLLNNDGDWIVEEAVKSPRCIPGLPGPVRYHGIDGWDEHGEPLPRDSNDYQQWLGECRLSS